jgi:RNA polymerase sigma factor (sigma-70 family)
MAGNPIHHVLRYLRRAAPEEGAAAPDAQLLERFVACRDEAAFEELAQRHGPMVLAVCRRVLGDAHEAEDAFQATFLVLARKAAAVARCRSAGGWLYTVAYRIALRARARRAGRSERELIPNELPPAAVADPADEAAWRDVRRVIDEEVSRLPEKYRLPFVLFHLEGRSSAEVARELGCPVGTAESWLSRARERLRDGLVRRGLDPAPGPFAGLTAPMSGLPQAAVQAVRAASGALSGAVSAEAAALAGEFLRAAGLTKSKIGLALLLVGCVMAGAIGLRAERTVAPQPPSRLAPVGRRTPDGATTDRPAAPEQVRWVHADRIITCYHCERDLCSGALSPDCKTLATGNVLDGQVRLWDATPGKSQVTMRLALRQSFAPCSIECLAFSPDSKMLASTGSDQTVKLWDVTTGQLKATFAARGLVRSVVFSPDGKILAWGGGIALTAVRPVRDLEDVPPAATTEGGEVNVCDLTTGTERTLYRGNDGRVAALAFSWDSKTLAAGAVDGTIRLWNVADGQKKACLREQAAPVRALAFSPDGKTLAALPSDQQGALEGTGQEQQIDLWDLAGRSVRARLRASCCMTLAFAPDGTLATGSDVVPADPMLGNQVTGEVRLWDATTGQPLSTPLEFQHRSTSVTFDASGRFLVVAGDFPSPRRGGITMWRLAPAPHVP